MTIKFNAFTAGLVGAAAMFSAAVAGPIAPAYSNEDQTGSIATTVSTIEAPNCVYCYSGVTGSPNNPATRGWVCQQETRH